MRVLSVSEVREFDRRAIQDLGIPSLVLMENAALGVVDAIGEQFPGARRIVLLCGPGNNGADGLAVARQLDARGYECLPVLARGGRELSADCARQLATLEALEIPVVELAEPSVEEFHVACSGADLVVDALYGCGLSRPLSGFAAGLIEIVNRCGRPVVAVDLPSGLDGDRPEPIGPSIRATLTVTFLALKPALVLPPALDFAGAVAVADLGIRGAEGGGPGALHLLRTAELAAALPVRAEGAHKGSFGHVLLVAGTEGKIGAAVLAARASVRAGAGLTTVAAPAGIVSALASGCPEAMTLPLAEREGALAPAGLGALVAAARQCTVVAMGPGLGRAEATAGLIRDLALTVDRPLVLDADALNAFEGRLDRLATRTAATVLTPHPGEMARLLGVDTATVERDRLVAARAAAARSGAVVVLKGRRSIVAEPDGEAWINPTGNPAMASGGSGDLLTGIVAARLAQGDEPGFAACLSVHLHGLAGDLAALQAGGPAVAASDTLNSWGAAWKELAQA